MENSSNSVDLNKWLMPSETAQNINNSGEGQSDRTVQYDVTAQGTNLIGDSQGESIYRSSMFVNLKQTPTTSTKGPETICGSTIHNSRPEELVISDVPETLRDKPH